MPNEEIKALNFFEPISVALTDATIDAEPTGADQEENASYSYSGNIPSFIVGEENSAIFAEFMATKSVGDQHSITVKATYGLGCSVIRAPDVENKELMRNLASQLVSLCIWPHFASFAACVSGFTFSTLPKLPIFPDADHFSFAFLDEEGMPEEYPETEEHNHTFDD